MRVLVVEDEERVARLIERALEGQGHAVDIATSGEEAIWFTSERPFDVIVLDVVIPSPDGIEVTRRLRHAEDWTPILLLTGKTDVEDRVRGLDAGADDYLPKPFSVAELTARIRALNRRKPRERPPELLVGDLRLDPVTREVERDSREIDLTPKEFVLLEFLMRHAGESLTRERILEGCWDFAQEGGSNVVDVYIRYLREKIDRPFDRESIQTVRGVGYRLDPEA